jgi:hypothetical protein
MGDHVLYMKLRPEEAWRRVPTALPGSARTMAAYDQCYAVKCVLRTLG